MEYFVLSREGQKRGPKKKSPDCPEPLGSVSSLLQPEVIMVETLTSNWFLASKM
jgi:hypothetical protein